MNNEIIKDLEIYAIGFVRSQNLLKYPRQYPSWDKFLMQAFEVSDATMVKDGELYVKIMAIVAKFIPNSSKELYGDVLAQIFYNVMHTEFLQYLHDMSLRFDEKVNQTIARQSHVSESFPESHPEAFQASKRLLTKVLADEEH